MRNIYVIYWGINMSNILNDKVEQILDAMTRIKDERAHIEDIWKQLKGDGYDVKVLKKAVALIDKDGIDKEREALQILNTYLKNLRQEELF